MPKPGITARNTIGSARYAEWRNAIVLDFGDYTFTRDELDEIGIGLHTKAASILQRIAQDEKINLAEIRRMKADGLYSLSGVGETCLIVAASCILASFPEFDFDAWVNSPSRTFRGGVRKVTAKKKKE